MKRRFGLTVMVLLAAMLALVGALRDTGTTRAGVPLPVKPVFPGNQSGGYNSTALGVPGWSFGETSNAHGSRSGMGTNWGFGSRGNPDISITNGDPLGSFTSYNDVFCDATDDAQGDGTDLFADSDGGTPASPIPCNGMDWMVPLTNGFGVTARFQTLMDFVWLNAVLPVPIPVVPVNILTLATPWAPHTGPSQIWVSGAPAMPSILCTQNAGGSWANSRSETNGNLTSPLPMTSTAPLRGDSGSPCTAGNCADFDLLGFWGAPSIATSSPASIAVTSRILNSGPAADGDFKEVWEVEAPTGVSASWDTTLSKQTNPGGASGTWSSVSAPSATVSGTMLSFHEAAMPKGQTNSYGGTLDLTCTGAGDYIVAIKAYAYPEGGDADNDLINNVAVSAVRIECPKATPEIDVQAMGIASALWSISGTSEDLNPTINQADLVPPGDHVQLLVGDSATLRYGAIVRNQSTVDDIDGKALISAAANDPDNDNDYELGLSWSTSVTGSFGSEPPAASLPSISASCVSMGGQACAGLDVSLTEPAGHMIDIVASLTVTCNEAGKFVMPVKIVNQAVDYGDPSPINNTFFEPAVVYCWASAGDRTAAIDGIDDSTGIYPSWSTSDVSGGNVDSRKPISPTNKPSTAMPQDIGYADRYIANPSCYFFSAAGSPDGGDGWVTPAESMATAPAGIDDDGDCLADAAAAQPGNAVDPNDASGGADCPAVIYNEGAGSFPQIQYTVNADEDCDGLLDGMEMAFGSNPRIADTDGDGLTDYYEMFQFTSPVNTDTDGDGYLDLPPSTYQNSSTAYDNCPGVYNPDQTNTDGLKRDNGDKIPGSFASNPNQDKLGDACDTDDDNDSLLDTAEELCLSTYGNPCDPLDPNTDGYTEVSGAYDRTIDGMEVLSGKDPTDPTSKVGLPPATLFTYLKACHLDLPGNTAFQAYNSNLWVENDPDGDGIDCPTDPDADNGVGDLAVAPLELSDNIEALGYGTAIARKDTDGDGCEDWIEAMDINGDRKVTVGDQTALAKRGVQLAGFEADVTSDAIYDVNKDGKISVGDQTLMAKNTCILKPSGIGCPGPCPSEN
jgi:hypothetical protein